MKKTDNFGLSVYEGPDKFNPLTVEAPNVVAIDKQMKKNQIASISPAVESVAGSTHAITCSVKDAVFIQFTATGDFHANDIFTLNAQPVQAVLSDGSSLPEAAYRTNSTVLASVVGSKLTVYTNAGSSTAANALKLGGKAPEYYGTAADSIRVYTHSKVGKNNNFVGIGANGRVQITARIDPGDSVQVNGQPVEAFMGADDFVTAVAGSDLVGKWLTFVYDGDALNFKGAGGGKVDVVGLNASTVVYDQTVIVRQGGRPVQSVTGTHVPQVVFPLTNFGPANYNTNTETRTFTPPAGNYILVYASYTKTGSAKLTFAGADPISLPTIDAPLTPALPGVDDPQGTYTAKTGVFAIQEDTKCNLAITTKKNTGNAVFLIMV